MNFEQTEFTATNEIENAVRSAEQATLSDATREAAESPKIGMLFEPVKFDRQEFEEKFYKPVTLFDAPPPIYVPPINYDYGSSGDSGANESDVDSGVNESDDTPKTSDVDEDTGWFKAILEKIFKPLLILFQKEKGADTEIINPGKEDPAFDSIVYEPKRYFGPSVESLERKVEEQRKHVDRCQEQLDWAIEHNTGVTSAMGALDSARRLLDLYAQQLAEARAAT